MNKLRYPLFFTRVSIFYFLLPWVLMRFSAPEKSKGIASKYYMIADMPNLLNTAIGVFWVVLIVSFVAGFKKRISYGLVLCFHTIGTVFTAPYLIVGTESARNVFFAAIPVIGAMLLLYLLREEDSFLAVDGKRSESQPKKGET